MVIVVGVGTFTMRQRIDSEPVLGVGRIIKEHFEKKAKGPFPGKYRPIIFFKPKIALILNATFIPSVLFF